MAGAPAGPALLRPASMRCPPPASLLLCDAPPPPAFPSCRMEQHLDILSVQASLLATAAEKGAQPSQWSRFFAYKTFFGRVYAGG